MDAMRPFDPEPAETATGQSPAPFGVGQLAFAIRSALEARFGRIRVRGEIVDYRGPHRSGHHYFALKDKDGLSTAKIDAVVWKTAVGRLGLRPENGTEVIATGKLTTYPDRGSYQLNVERLEYAGEGALQARIEAIKAKLLAEGLFDAARKRPIPFLPRVIGIVTSPQGAVIRDILHRLTERFPCRVLVWPVPVQGEGAAAQVAAAIEGFGRLPERASPGAPDLVRPDLVIVARGGGSLEDLMAFNEEVVVRAAALCPIPLISAVGHETDHTLIDLAADLRAPTPTAAAEKAVPVRAELVADVKQLDGRMASAWARASEVRRLRLERAARGLPDLPGLIGAARQRLDDRSDRLAAALPGFVLRRRELLSRLQARLPAPTTRIEAARGRLLRADAALGAALLARRAIAARRLDQAGSVEAPLRAGLRERCIRLDGLVGRLEALSYRNVLARGFALVEGEDGSARSRAAQLHEGEAVRLRFADASVAARIEPHGESSPEGPQGATAAEERADGGAVRRAVADPTAASRRAARGKPTPPGQEQLL